MAQDALQIVLVDRVEDSLTAAFVDNPEHGFRGIRGDFDCACCREDVARTKPYPDLYLAALACLGVSALETVALEDSPNGIAAAKRAGLRCVAIPNSITAQLDLSQADVILGSLAEVSLAELLEKIAQR